MVEILRGITKMQTLNFQKVVLSVMVVAQLLGTEAFAHTKFKEVILTKDKEALRNPYYQIKSVQVKELTDEESLEFIADLPEQTSNSKNLTLPVTNVNTTGADVVTSGATTTATGVLDGIIMVVDKLIAIGQKIIPTIEKGKAVVTNTSMAAVSVLPRVDAKDAVVHDMGGWSLPVTKHYKISYKNGFGSEVITFVYSVSYQYGGTYGGKGQYLTGITASARNISIGWGFDLDASSQLIQISNVGSETSVVAAAKIEMAYTVKNWTRTDANYVSFFVVGDGRLLKLD
jgi:hypothetical protein